MNQVKTNKWSLFKDFDLWEYSFSADFMEKQGLNYSDLLRLFITACHTSGVSKLRHHGKEIAKENFPSELDNMLQFLEEIKSKNGYGIYPKISTDAIYNFEKENYFEYIFDNGLYVYDKSGVVVHKNFLLTEMKPMLEEIGHGQADYTGLSLPFEFGANYDMNSDETVQNYRFTILFFTDIWLDEVPCIHCEEEESIKNDNSELAALNRENMNNFLSQMKQVCTDFGGEIIVEQENLRWLYQGKFGENGFIL